MRLLICAGGTGGGVYPALAVLHALKVESLRLMELSTLWVGGQGGMEEDLVRRADIDFEAIPAAGVHGVGLRALPGNLWQVGRGYLAARRLLRRFRPDVMFFTGGYVAVPVALASRLHRGASRPLILLYVPDIEPGMALKILSRFAEHIAVTSEKSRRYFAGHPSVTVTGYPVRPDLKKWTKADARDTLGLEEDSPVLFVFGGSRGAHSINRAVIGSLPELIEEMQVVHISGSQDWPEVERARAHLPGEYSSRYQAYPYLHNEMGAALAAADLAVSRAGASSLGEFPLFGLPAVLVPYPHAWRYQQVNASYLAERGAAVVVSDEDLPGGLLPVVINLIKDSGRLYTMQQAMRSLAKPDADSSIASLLLALADMRSHRRV